MSYRTELARFAASAVASVLLGGCAVEAEPEDSNVPEGMEEVHLGPNEGALMSGSVEAAMGMCGCYFSWATDSYWCPYGWEQCVASYGGGSMSGGGGPSCSTWQTYSDTGPCHRSEWRECHDGSYVYTHIRYICVNSGDSDECQCYDGAVIREERIG